jgi:transposase
MVLNGILYVLTTGCRWMDMPLEYGSYKTAWRRLKCGRILFNDIEAAEKFLRDRPITEDDICLEDY